MTTTFEKAIKRTEKINKYLDSRSWGDCSDYPMRDTQVKILKLQQTRVDDEISQLQVYAKECRSTIDDELYTSPFGPNGQEKITTTKKDKRDAQVELNKITKAIEDLRGLWLQLLDDETNLYKVAE